MFKPVFWLFAAFILLCGTTHWLELATIWVPAYRFEAVSKLTTAAVSSPPWSRSGSSAAGPGASIACEMRAANDALTVSDARLRALNASLEAKVEERTSKLIEHEARQRDLLATINLGTFITRDLDGIIRFWSEGCTRLVRLGAGASRRPQYA